MSESDESTEATCEEALAELYLFLDGELGDEHRAHVELHLRRCAPCLEAFDFEAELQRIVNRRCRDTAPNALRSRIMDALTVAEIAQRDRSG